jgi:hypothetical protein
MMSGETGDDELRLEVSAPSTATFDISGNTFDGGADTDVFDLSQLDIGSGVTVDLAAQSVTIAGGVNTVLNIESVIGTNYSDTIVGSTASETFVFIDAFGEDSVYDFNQGEGDLIEFQVAGVDSFDDLTIAFDGTDTVITTSASATDSVTLVDYGDTVNPLTVDDFGFIIV